MRTCLCFIALTLTELFNTSAFSYLVYLLSKFIRTPIPSQKNEQVDDSLVKLKPFFDHL